MAIRNDFTAGEVLAAADLNDTFAAKRDLSFPVGKILQIVRATDSTQRTTTSTTFVDADISVTITPQKDDSAVILLYSAQARSSTTNNSQIRIALTDSSNNVLSGGEQGTVGVTGANSSIGQITILAYSTPATVNATTFKARFSRGSVTGSVSIRNDLITGQLYAIEVSA